jgi:hypothetical protein
VWGLLLAVVAGCQNGAQNGALIGSLAGAGIGQLAGGDTEATLLGAAIGAGGGYLLGNEGDKAKQQRQMYAMRDDMNSQLVNVTNSNGSIIQVRLRRQGVGWVGTRGEYYPTLPTGEQLRPVYGF